VETRAGGRELQRRENLLYVGIALHKETHTAVMVNCWNEKLEVVTIENKPSEFRKLAEKVEQVCHPDNKTPCWADVKKTSENCFLYIRFSHFLSTKMALKLLVNHGVENDAG
jgi:hypothetical protein